MILLEEHHPINQNKELPKAGENNPSQSKRGPTKPIWYHVVGSILIKASNSLYRGSLDTRTCSGNAFVCRLDPTVMDIDFVLFSIVLKHTSHINMYVWASSYDWK